MELITLSVDARGPTEPCFPLGSTGPLSPSGPMVPGDPCLP